MWLNSKKFVYTQNGVTSYFWDDLQCEICKEFFLLKMWVNGQLVDLLSYPKPSNGKYMIFESDMPSSLIKQKAVHVLDFGVQSHF